jgi:hypothetical protein
MEAVVAELPGVIETCVVSAFDAKFVEAPAAIVYTEQDMTADAVTENCGTSRRLQGAAPRHRPALTVTLWGASPFLGLVEHHPNRIRLGHIDGRRHAAVYPPSAVIAVPVM